ncbi:MAG: S-layer homology domain-containing protein [Oscillospiraceae bacterium]|nr:S-layer homology domain-containing protein [Oscillospiraceae bacterium]
MKKVITIIFAIIITVLCSHYSDEIKSNPLSALTAEAAVLPNSSRNVGPRVNSADDPPNGIYVSPTGNDSTATGFIDKPYKSINTALAAAQPGDTIILRGGTYREGINVRVRIPNITIKSKKGEWAVIDLTTYNSGHDEDSGVYFDVDSSGGRLQNVEVMGGFYAVCMETKWNWGGEDDWVAASNIIIEDCILHDSRYDVVKVKPNCDNITIRYNEIYNSGRAEIKNPNWLYGEANAEGIDNVNGDNMKAQNNYIHDIGGNGIYAKGGAADVLIENNRIERIYGAGIMVGFDTSPEYFDIAVNSQYYENIRGIVRNNLIIDTGWEGIGLYGSKDAQIYNNTLVNVDNGPGKYHSAVYFGLTYQDWENYAGRPANVNPNIHHNIVCQPASFDRPMIEIRFDDNDQLGKLSALDGNPVMNNNCYYIAGKSAMFNDFRPGKELENAGLSAWQKHIGGDSGSIEIDPILDIYYMPANLQCAEMGYSNFSTLPFMSNFLKVKTYKPGQFADVKTSDWFSGSIAAVYEYGLMQGNSANTFNPAGYISVAEAVTVAARVHSIYNTGKDNFTQTPVWYQAYVDYAIENGIINAVMFSDYNKTTTRAEMAYIFSRTLPEAEFTQQNTVNSLPDVNNSTPYSAAIFMLYRAGVLTGSGNQSTFNPGSNITRGEAAAIISRVILPSTRMSGKTFG